MQIQFVLLAILCYLVGSIPFSYLFVRLMKGFDIRKQGSGNVGSTNVLRTAGKGIAIAAFAGDLLKGALAAWLGLHYGGIGLASACALAAVIGHCWSVFLRFSGGKGVATSGGAALVLMPKITLILLVILIIIVVISRYVSLGSISVAVLLPILATIFHEPAQLIKWSFFIMALVIFHHRENITRLRNGTEGKIGQ